MKRLLLKVLEKSLIIFLMFSCQNDEVSFADFKKYINSDLNYKDKITNSTFLVIDLNSCLICLEKIGKTLKIYNQKTSLNIVISANTKKEINQYLKSHQLNNKLVVIPDLKSALFNQPFYDGSAGYFFKVGQNKIEKIIRFDINHNFEVFEKELLTTN